MITSIVEDECSNYFNYECVWMSFDDYLFAYLYLRKKQICSVLFINNVPNPNKYHVEMFPVLIRSYY